MARTWSYTDAAKLTRAIYHQILERDADDGGLISWGSSLARGEKSVRDVVRDIGLSEEYRQKFVWDVTPRETVELLYKHILVRAPESSEAINYWSGVFSDRGYSTVLKGFVDSDEYVKRFGSDTVPH